MQSKLPSLLQLSHSLAQQVQHLLVDAWNVCHHQVLISRDRHEYIQIIFATYTEKVVVYMRKKLRTV